MAALITIPDYAIKDIVTINEMVDCLRSAFARDFLSMPRHVDQIPGPDQERLLVTMPAFDAAGNGAIKLATVYPHNIEVPSIHALIVLFSNAGGPEAVLDGTIVTLMRTAAASALASTFLSREDSTNLVVVGTGALAPHMAAAHCAVRPLKHVTICGRSLERATATAELVRTMVPDDILVFPVDNGEAAVREADIVSCATSSARPVVKGEWLAPGVFVDLVGSFSPDRREADDELVRRCNVYVDTFDGALAEAGDLLQPIASGILERQAIRGDLHALTKGEATGRTTHHECIMFKSVGTALEDLAVSQLIVRKFKHSRDRAVD
jgi:ornithine cyclodeaminase